MNSLVTNLNATYKDLSDVTGEVVDLHVKSQVLRSDVDSLSKTVASGNKAAAQANFEGLGQRTGTLETSTKDLQGRTSESARDISDLSKTTSLLSSRELSNTNGVVQVLRVDVDVDGLLPTAERLNKQTAQLSSDLKSVSSNLNSV